MRKWLLIAFFGTSLIGACFGAATIIDERNRLSEGEFRRRIERDLSYGANAAAVAAYLEELKGAHRSDGAEISVYPVSAVEQYDCLPRPCSLVDRGVPVGHMVVSALILNPPLWRSLCEDAYLAYFVFDREDRFYDLKFEEDDTCI